MSAPACAPVAGGARRLQQSRNLRAAVLGFVLHVQVQRHAGARLAAGDQRLKEGGLLAAGDDVCR